MRLDRYSPVFAIAQAAELAEMHPQTLRQYDRIGLVCPQRTSGNTRRYSLHNIDQLQQIAQLTAEGLTLEGIRRVMALQNEVERLNARVRELERALADGVMAQPQRVFAAGASGEVISLRRGTRVRGSGELMVWRPTRIGR